MAIAYALTALSAVVLSAIECWPAVVVLVLLGILMCFSADLRAVRLKRRARKVPAVATS